MTFHTIVLAWIGIALGAFVYLLFRPAPYGRYVEKGWGPILNNRVAWILMETPVFIILLTYLILNFSTIALANKLLIGLFLLHYFNRCFIYPFCLKKAQAKMPLTIVLSAVFFNLVNGNILGYSFSFDPVVSVFDWKFGLGIILFILGMIINIWADATLIKLKRSSNQYSIPKGMLYEYVSCPNYLGEILEWTGFALAAGNLGALSFLVWTCANLIPRALANHRWYKLKFHEYPKKRKAIFPFLL